jgi:hydrogenase nickel incorporation protein HypA/HybF
MAKLMRAGLEHHDIHQCEIMHELSIAMSILDLAAEEAERQGGARVLEIHLKLGRLSGVVKEALLSAYELARESTALEEAQLVIEEVAVRVHCPACNTTRAVVSAQQLCCAECGTPSADVVSGRELEVFAMEIQ